MASSSDNIPASIPPRPGSGPDTEIAPQLESVLRNLNVNLEDELTRYRRQRHGRVPPPPPPRRTAQRQTLDLISVAASAPESARLQPPTPPPPPPNPFLKQDSEQAPALPDTEAFPASDMGLEAGPEILPEIGDMDLGLEGELGLDMGESGAPTGLSGLNTEETDEALAQLDPANADANESALPIHASDSPTDSYLESSEELLKSIEEEQAAPSSMPEPYSPERKNNSLLKLAGLVLVVLGGIGVGFAITNPAQLQSLRSRLFPTGESTPNGTDTAETAGEGNAALPDSTETTAEAGSNDASGSPEVSPDSYKPPGPDLSTREFKKLDDVKDLVTLDLDGTNGTGAAPTTLPANPAQSTLPNPAQSPGTAPATGQPLPSPASPANPAANPATVGAAPATPATPAPSAPAPSAPAPAPPATAVAGSNFYVIASYTGDASLNKAREFVPDAFVRNFQAGARIQLAAFNNREQAAEQVAFLTQQGITVELFGPTNE